MGTLASRWMPRQRTPAEPLFIQGIIPGNVLIEQAQGRSTVLVLIGIGIGAGEKQPGPDVGGDDGDEEWEKREAGTEAGADKGVENAACRQNPSRGLNFSASPSITFTILSFFSLVRSTWRICFMGRG